MTSKTATGREASEADAVPAARRGWTLALAGMGAFLCSLDVVVVATALPVLRTHLGASLSDLEWTINAYNLAFACLMLTGSALGDRFGRRRIYVTGLAVFTAASAACALAGGAGALVAARVVEGAGAALLLPLTLTLISDVFPAERRGAAIGLWGGITGLGVAGGPVLGGAITEGLAWQWIFWINVPVGLVMIPLSATLLRESRGPRPYLDVPGQILAGLGMFALTWAPVRAPSAGWDSPEVAAALAAGAVLVAAFLLWERRAAHPMLPLAYFRLRAFASANAVIFLQAVSLLGSLFMITQLFQTGLGDSPLETGVRLLVWTGMPMIAAPLAGALADRVGPRPLMAAGMVLQCAGLGWLASATAPDVSYGTLVAPLVVAGAGTGMIFATTAGAATAAVPAGDAGVAAGTNTALRELGGVFGIAVLAAVFAHSGGYETPASFVDGFKPALWVASAVAGAGVVAALCVPAKARAVPEDSAGPAEPAESAGPRSAASGS
ncbi:MFS transporter [Actinomadura nitritigenes]|uniref:MFS transporter n=1 Tax=Actinomadura nitritigenes TaxID=134602 RepID=A0ABS3R5Z2_9ACTN|nr:MFS transporter [Actinomadura nitritigenes]MBO2441232.1 MFS transporter [Actinomadura nitritigenes]